jgi:hypothetical protein
MDIDGGGDDSSPKAFQVMNAMAKLLMSLKICWLTAIPIFSRLLAMNFHPHPYYPFKPLNSAHKCGVITVSNN